MRMAASWLVCSLALNLAWEVGQLPLYTLYRDSSRADIAYAIAHCTAGDLLISSAIYACVAALCRSWRWPAIFQVPGTAAFIAAGVAYTVFSEWLNVYVRGSWAYTEWMPQLFGIGLSPLLQWVVVPAAATAAFRALLRTGFLSET